MLTYELKQAPANMVIVEVDSDLQDTINYGSITLHIDPLFNPTENAKIFGRVIAVPKGKAYTENGEEIPKTVEVGDKVYFHYLTTNNEVNRIYGNYYKVPYCWIFCSVRDNVILPVGEWTLCEQFVEKEDLFEEVDVLNQKLKAIVSSSGLVTGLEKRKSNNITILRHIGKPLVGKEAIQANVGDKVLLEKNCNFKNTIEDKEYFTVRQSDIMGIATM